MQPYDPRRERRGCLLQASGGGASYLVFSRLQRSTLDVDETRTSQPIVQPIPNDAGEDDTPQGTVQATGSAN